MTDQKIATHEQPFIATDQSSKNKKISRLLKVLLKYCKIINKKMDRKSQKSSDRTTIGIQTKRPVNTNKTRLSDISFTHNYRPESPSNHDTNCLV